MIVIPMKHDELPDISNYTVNNYTSDATHMAGGIHYSPDYQTSANSFLLGVSPTFDRKVEDSLKQIVKEKVMSDKVSVRHVVVYIVDPDLKVPVEKRILHKQEFTTDLTDQELFYEVEVKKLLEAHNKFRVTIPDKKITDIRGKEAYLEPIRIKDLKMQVSEMMRV